MIQIRKFGNLLIAILFIVFLCTLTSCATPYLKKQKPSSYYYSSKLATNLSSSKNFKITLLDTNFYKNKLLQKKDLSTIICFMNTLDKKNFIKKPYNLPENPDYKIFLDLTNSKFVINVYNENYISIFPWDGTYDMDFIDMRNVNTRYNLYNLCKYLIPRDNN